MTDQYVTEVCHKQLQLQTCNAAQMSTADIRHCQDYSSVSTAGKYTLPRCHYVQTFPGNSVMQH